MYVELHNYQELEQKILFFKLKTVFNLDNSDAVDRKIAGIYAIFKDDICLYVGQSTNLASRLATHIKGKYSEATKIYILNIEKIGWNNFKERSKEAQNEILLNAEKFTMSKLNPIENINIEHDFKLEEKFAPQISLQYDYKEADFYISLNRDMHEDALIIYSERTINNEVEFGAYEDLNKLASGIANETIDKNSAINGIVAVAERFIDEINQ